MIFCLIIIIINLVGLVKKITNIPDKLEINDSDSDDFEYVEKPIVAYKIEYRKRNNTF